MKDVLRLIAWGISLAIPLGFFPLQAEARQKVVATNSWTAAFARAAGAEEVEMLAPADAVHPPEYELRPSDVQKVRDADLLVYAGYEVLMRTIFENFDKAEEELIKIQTSYAPAVLKRSILTIARAAGTRNKAERSLEKLDRFFRRAIAALKAQNLHGAKVLVHFHQRPLIEALGFEILGVFGPAPLEAKQLGEFGGLTPRLIIDNAHNPTAFPLEEIINVPAVGLINFPPTLPDGGEEGTSLSDVLEYNFNKILEGMK